MQSIQIVTQGINLEPLTKIKKDVKIAAATMTDDEARYLVDTYYQMQDQRIRADGQVRSIVKSDKYEPHETLSYVSDQANMLENQIKGALGHYVRGKEIGRWLLSIVGIGDVLAAGLLAHIDIKKAKTAGAIWRYAGQDPTLEWKKGEKRPYNASLKTLCWKIGESFVKVSNNENALYGKLYKERKAIEIAKNEAGEFAEQAKAKLEKYKIGKNTDAYKAYSVGKLPPAHIQARAKRYAVKIFLSHLFDTWYRIEYNEAPPKPFAIAILQHAHMIEPL